MSRSRQHRRQRDRRGPCSRSAQETHQPPRSPERVSGRRTSAVAQSQSASQQRRAPVSKPLTGRAAQPPPVEDADRARDRDPRVRRALPQHPSPALRPRLGRPRRSRKQNGSSSGISASSLGPRQQQAMFNRWQLVSPLGRLRMSTQARKTINNNGPVQNPGSAETRADQSLRGSRPGSHRSGWVRVECCALLRVRSQTGPAGRAAVSALALVASMFLEWYRLDLPGRIGGREIKVDSYSAYDALRRADVYLVVAAALALLFAGVPDEQRCPQPERNRRGVRARDDRKRHRRRHRQPCGERERLWRLYSARPKQVAERDHSRVSSVGPRSGATPASAVGRASRLPHG